MNEAASFRPELEGEDRSILDAISLDMSQDDVKKLFTPIITPEERKVLGEDAESLMMSALVGSVAFAFGGDFDSEAFAAVVDDELAQHLDQIHDNPDLEYTDVLDDNVDPDRINAILQITIRAGIIGIKENGRLFFFPEFTEKMEVFFPE